MWLTSEVCVVHVHPWLNGSSMEDCMHREGVLPELSHIALYSKSLGNVQIVENYSIFWFIKYLLGEITAN